ncbi:hypothetical protein RAC89_17480 [Paenibacillus sp. GD4]|uniref:hypothetical protein n=1 Tax=Paenibacillus sp. GD4 TaxID=3068890 RepID=UPI0027967C68|nr:hypothetical protein [Paenibacillus sp. GD4]MDQ1912181.1 hypothetical protein [Paenibacillus sp. GD4]
MTDRNEITDWLLSCKGETLLIEKRETDDTDLTRVELKDVSYTDHFQNQTDEYLAKEKLILLGSGTVLNSAEQPPLPDEAYEIPLLGDWEGSLQGEALHITTERATYHITKEQ